MYDYGFYSAYNIELEKENGEASLISGNVKIGIESDDLGSGKNREYKVIHILNDGNLEEIEKVEVLENKIEFETESLSTFVILERESKNDVETNETQQDAVILEESSNDLIMTMDLNTGLEAWDGSVADSFSWGDGTKETPYLIADGKELAYLRNQVASGNTYEGQYFQIANDIDLGGREWTPIGTSQNSFRGILEGAGHTIANATITVASLPDQSYEAYGIFASIGGGNTRTIIRNLELSNINVEITASGDTGSTSSNMFGGSVEQDDEGLHIGTLAGAMYRNASILNVIVENSVIQDTNEINIIDSPFQFSVGGVVGYIANSYNNNNNPGANNTYVIDNCYAETQISLDATADEGSVGGWFGSSRVEYNGHGQYHTGGIVGTIRGQAVWPTNTLYSGSINANGFIGPIFGGLINNTGYTDYDTYSTIWNGNDAGNVTINNMYFTNYRANNRSFTTSVTSGNSNQRVSNNSSNIGYVQGVNKGIYTNNMNTVLNVFNNNVNTDNQYLTWNYENGNFSFKERLTTTVNENPENTYNIVITDTYQIDEYIIRWYKNGVEDSSIQGTSYTWKENYAEDENMLVVTFDGEYYTISKFTIERIGVDIVFNINENNDSVTASLEGPGLKYTSVNDFTFQWYKEDIAGTSEMLEGETRAYINWARRWNGI